MPSSPSSSARTARRPRMAGSMPRRSTAITPRSRRCSKPSCRAAPATCWRSAAAPASTPSRSPASCRRSPGGRPTSTTITCAASRPGARMRSSTTCRAPVRLDASAAGLAPAARSACPPQFIAMFCANVIHIAPWAVAEGLFAGAGRHLRGGRPAVPLRPVQARRRSTTRRATPRSTKALRARQSGMGRARHRRSEKASASERASLRRARSRCRRTTQSWNVRRAHQSGLKFIATPLMQ